MTQKTLAQQIAEMQNNLTALDKIINAPAVVALSAPKIQNIVITYDDGTTATFVQQVTSSEVLAEIRSRAIKVAPINTATDPLASRTYIKPGYACIINGVKYNSIMHASRVLKICRHAIKANLDSDLANWSYTYE